MHMSLGNNHSSRRAIARRSLTIAVITALSLGATAPVFAQATTGSIYGDAPAGTNETVTLTNSSGLSRTITVGADGRFAASSLPLGTYTVSLLRDGATVDTRNNITLSAGGATQVSFNAASGANAAGATELGAMQVTANALPAIDVSQVDSRTTITSQQLAKLPLQRSAEAIATLAPGVNSGTSLLTGEGGQILNSFGGSSIAENAYYINGFNTTDPLRNFGGLTLPYGAIDQEQVLTGGYGAQYGRSDGGVISQVGKRGTNEWHFGAQVLFTPKALESDPKNIYYPVGPQYASADDGGRQGQLYRYRNNNKDTTETVDGYFGGPLIKDKLFIFGAVEAERRVDGRNTGSSDTGLDQTYSYTDPKWYAKLDWNITDNNILEFTGASQKTEYDPQAYTYSYPVGSPKGERDQYIGKGIATKQGADVGILKYTGYVTDDITIDALYGKMKQTDVTTIAPGAANLIIGAANQNPAFTGGNSITGTSVATSTVDNPNIVDKTRNARFDINWKVGSHSITAGMDNMDIQSLNAGSEYPGGYAWSYGNGDPNTPISTQAGEGVGAPGGDGYYVSKTVFQTFAPSVRVKQRAQFIQDEWQVTDRVLLSIGLRNDQFTNYNPDGAAYIRLTRPNLSPRLGASWDVFGDSSMKVYANAGRYYLDEPSNVAVRGAAGSVFTNQYFTYTGIDPTTGAPTGLTQIPQDRYPGVSANLEFGTPPDPKQVTSKNVQAEYQDEYIAGIDKSFDMFGDKWTAGAKGVWRKLRNDLDDVCDTAVFGAAGVAQGFDETAAEGQGCYIMNPGKNSTFNVPRGDGTYGTMTVPWSAFNMPDLKRKYAALNMYLEHPYDGKWYGRLDYTWSHSFGNTEGSVRSDIGQNDVSQTEDWDNQGVMQYSNGDQANDRRHQIKAIGYYQITPEWLVGATMQVLSGTPKTCLGFLGPQQDDPYNYGVAYHYCGPEGTPAPPGKTGRTPWTEIFSLNAEYRPAFADHKLAFNVLVYNLFNQQRPTQFDNTSESGAFTTSPNFFLPLSYETPRYVQFGVTYDF
jgi:hypothetical protein